MKEDTQQKQKKADQTGRETISKQKQTRTRRGEKGIDPRKGKYIPPHSLPIFEAQTGEGIRKSNQNADMKKKKVTLRYFSP